MIAEPLFYKLLLVSLVWLCLVLHLVWSDDRARAGHSTPLPAKPPRKRSQEPKPFAGLTQQPLCTLCEQEIAHPTAPPCTFAPLSAVPIKAGWGWVNLRANGHPSGGPWRQFHCTSCQGYFLETHGTLFHGKRVAVELMVRVLACLAEGLGIRATARVFEVDPHTVLGWLVEAADQLQAFSRYVLCEVHVRQIQVDELYAVLSAVKDGELSEDEAIKRLSRSPQWVWTAMDPETKLLLVIDVGTRTLAMTQRVLHQVAQTLAPDCVPLFLSDGFKDYLCAILTHFGCWVQPERRQAKGAAPKPRWMPLPGLLYAQVIKTTRRRRLVRVTHRVVFGTLDAIEQVLAACGWQINTAFIERLNLSIRHHVAAIGRRVNTVCKGEDGLRQQVVLFQVYYNFCLSHTSLRQLLLVAEPTRGGGSAKQWRPCTPAMAAGLTDRVWTLREVLLFRVPPWPQPAGV